ESGTWPRNQADFTKLDSVPSVVVFFPMTRLVAQWFTSEYAVIRGLSPSRSRTGRPSLPTPVLDCKCVTSRARQMKLLAICCAVLAFAFATITVAAQVTTSQYDNLRTGATLNGTILIPESVNVKQFGRLGAFRVDGAVYAQPLFIPSLDIPGKGTHDVLFVATEHDSVYAFNADRPNDPPLWHVSVLDKKRGDTTVSARDVQCP